MAIVQTNSNLVLCARGTDFQLEAWLLWFTFLRGFHQALQRKVGILSSLHSDKLCTYFYNSASHQRHDSSVVRQTAKKEVATYTETSIPLCLTSPLYITQIIYTSCAYNPVEFTSSILILLLLKSANFKTLGSEDKRNRLCCNTGTCPPNYTASISGHNNL